MENKKINLVVNEEKGKDIKLFSLALHTNEAQINLSEYIKHNIASRDAVGLCSDIEEHLTPIINKLKDLLNDVSKDAVAIQTFDVILDTEGEITIKFSDDIKKIKDIEYSKGMLYYDIKKYLTPIIQKLIIAAF